MRSQSSATISTHQGNNFDVIRIIAASLVLYSHHFALTGQMEPSFFGVHSLGGLAVAIFFVISGYLVAMSWQRDPSVWRFALRRFLRIWPALTAALVVTAYGLGAWLTKLPLMEYWTHPGTLQYLDGLWMKIHYVLPGVFESNPYPLGVNGSLWTIPLEVRCYIVLAAMGLLGLLRWRPVLLACIAVYMVWFFARSNADVTGAVHYGRELSAFFLMGVTLFTVEGSWKRRPALWALVLSIATAIAWAFGWKHTAVLIGLPFAVLWLGTRSTPILRAAGRWGDPSYGIYLFAFPIQQTIILYTWPALGFWSTMGLAWVLTALLAYLSWHGLEKQALKLKPRSQQSKGTMDRLRSFCSDLQRLPWAWIWPALATVAGLRFMATQLSAPVLYDPAMTYLPAAREVLEHGWKFFLQQESYYVAPLAYLWPALWKADPSLIRIANMGLWVGFVWFMWRTCHLLGGVRAGALAMLLLLSPELMRYFPTEMTEPIYLFGLMGWVHAMARIILKQEHSIAVIVQGAFMLSVTLLSRPVLQLIVPAALVIYGSYTIYCILSKKSILTPEWHRSLNTIAWSLIWGIALPIALILKNGLVFGLWGLGTGSGTGLYLGTHPLTQGAEPDFLGLQFDIAQMLTIAGAGDSSHLTKTADGISRQGALWHLQSMPLAESITFFMRKLWWWLAHHPEQIETYGSALRKLRIFELLLLVTSIAWFFGCRLLRPPARQAWIHQFTATQWIFATFLLAMFLSMLVQLMPILYNSRYSATLLDPWIIPLAAFGFSFLTSAMSRAPVSGSRVGYHVRNIRSHLLPVGLPLFALTIIVLLTFGGYHWSRKNESIAIDPNHLGSISTHLAISSSEKMTTQGMRPEKPSSWVFTSSPAVLLVRIDPSDVNKVSTDKVFNAMWETEISLQSPTGQCGKIRMAYQTDGGQVLQSIHKLSLQQSLKADGTSHRYVTHANHQLRPTEPGYLRLELDCPIGSVLQWQGTQLHESRHAWDAAAHSTP